jgi:hypothetical protein
MESIGIARFFPMLGVFKRWKSVKLVMKKTHFRAISVCVVFLKVFEKMTLLGECACR